MQTRRGGFLTTMAILLAFAAIEDLLKPFGREGPTASARFVPRIQPGVVALGVRYTGSAALVPGVMLGAFLIVYAIGIWRMRRYAFTLAWVYAAYVILNVTLFTIRNPLPPTQGEMIFAIVYCVTAITLAVCVAITLTRRRADLARHIA